MAKTARSTEATASIAPKGTKVTEVILGTAAVKLGTGVKALLEMIDEVGKLGETINTNLLLISSQEDKLDNLALEVRNTIAQNKIEIEQAYESDKEAFVIQWLEENNSIAMDKTALAKLEQDLTAAQDATDSEVKKQVAIVTNTLESKHKAAIREQELTFAAKEASNNAALSQKDDKIKFLEEQVAAWKKALENEQEASIKRAQAGAIQQTIQTGK